MYSRTSAEQNAENHHQEAHAASVTSTTQVVAVKYTATIEPVNPPHSDWQLGAFFIFLILPLALAVAFTFFWQNMRTKNTTPIGLGKMLADDLPPLSFPLNCANPTSITDWLERD